MKEWEQWEKERPAPIQPVVSCSGELPQPFENWDEDPLCPTYSWPKAVDLRSVVERLVEHFNALEFDAEHKINYNRGFYTEEECYVFAKKYAEGVALCRAYLADLLTVEILMDLLIDVGLAQFVEDIKEFVHVDEECKKNDN
ncbi:hypothetical protein FQR65_LT16091 [Abscondita terminalis]|nr:hypothetical protein FQR65_LT16091 [Abscondita terminalis]